MNQGALILVHLGSTDSVLFYHFVWGTKGRRRLIAAPWEPRLRAWLGGAVRHLDAVADSIHGVRRYIPKQKEHHQRMSWVEELQGLLKRADVSYDPKYLL